MTLNKKAGRWVFTTCRQIDVQQKSGKLAFWDLEAKWRLTTMWEVDTSQLVGKMMINHKVVRCCATYGKNDAQQLRRLMKLKKCQQCGEMTVDGQGIKKALHTESQQWWLQSSRTKLCNNDIITLYIYNIIKWQADNDNERFTLDRKLPLKWRQMLAAISWDS